MKTSKNQYPITDPIAKAVLIDGLATAQILALPHLITGVAFCIPVLSPGAIVATTATSTLAAFIAYFLRTEARNDGHEYIGGYFGGIAKYAIKGNSQLVNLAVGGPNNLAYELCNNNEQCNNDVPTNIITTIATETLDELAQAALKGNSLLEGTAVGAIAGIIVALDAHLIYGNSIQSVHNFVDYFYKEEDPHMDLVPIFINKTPIDGFIDGYNLCLIN